MGHIGDRIIYEDERVRIWEMVLEPGEASPAHHHELDYVVAVVEGDRLAVEPVGDDDARGGPGYGDEPVGPGSVYSLRRGASEVARNTGETTYRDIQIEFK